MMRQGIVLAIAEQRANPRSIICLVAAFCAMLTPLLLLLGLKTGLVDSLMAELMARPQSREILPVGAGRYDGTFFTRVAALPQTAFIAPATRTIAARFAYARVNGATPRLRSLAIWPSGQGDPLLPDGVEAPAVTEVVLTQESARRLGATPGLSLDVAVVRHRNGHDEIAHATLDIIAVAEPEATGAAAALVAPALLFAVEAFLDDPSIVPERWLATSGLRRFPETASFRLYARTIHDVVPLRDAVEALGASVRVRSDEVAGVIRLDRALDRIYAVVALCAATGFWLALAANLRANVERLRPALSTLALLGARPSVRLAVPLVQAATIAVLGFGASLVVYLLGSRGFDLLLADVVTSPDRLSHLTLSQLFVAGLLVAAGALLAALWAVPAALDVDAEEVLRWQ